MITMSHSTGIYIKKDDKPKELQTEDMSSGYIYIYYSLWHTLYILRILLIF